jgi:hypothetical protein
MGWWWFRGWYGVGSFEGFEVGVVVGIYDGFEVGVGSCEGFEVRVRVWCWDRWCFWCCNGVCSCENMYLVLLCNSVKTSKKLWVTESKLDVPLIVFEFLLDCLFSISIFKRFYSGYGSIMIRDNDNDLLKLNVFIASSSKYLNLFWL